MTRGVGVNPFEIGVGQEESALSTVLGSSVLRWVGLVNSSAYESEVIGTRRLRDG